MLSIEQCRKILKNTGDNLSDDQIRDILKHFELYSSIIYKQIKKEDHDKKSDTVHPGING